VRSVRLSTFATLFESRTHLMRRAERPYSSMSRLRTLERMEAYVGSSGKDNVSAANQLRNAPPMRIGYPHRMKMKHLATCSSALALGFAMGLVFRGTENLALLEWVMVLLAIAAMAAWYCIRGIELDGVEDARRPDATCAGRSGSAYEGNRIRRQREVATRQRRPVRAPQRRGDVSV
jgi:hypothetical protein